MTIQGLINKIFKANQTPNNTVSWSGVNGLKSIQEDIVDTIRQRTFFTVPTTADLVNQGYNNAVLCYVQDHAFFRWEANGVPNGTTIFPANDGGVWVQETLGDTDGTVTSIGITAPAAFTVTGSPVTTSGVIDIAANGTSSQYIKGDGTLGTLPTPTGGTVTNVSALSIDSLGTDLSSTVSNPTTTPVITLSVPTASAVNRGVLSPADWTTFNSKQNSITLTTTGTSGAATLVGSTLNIPQYQSALTNPVTGTGTADYLPKWTSSSAIGNSLIYDNGTNIGIGTNSPNTYLTSTQGLVIYSVGVPSLALATSAANAWTNYLVTNQYRLYHSTNGVLMTVVSNGNVLIGTTTDSGYKLDVNGTVRTQGLLTASGEMTVGGTSRFKIFSSTGLDITGSTGTAYDVAFRNSSGGLAFGINAGLTSVYFANSVSVAVGLTVSGTSTFGTINNFSGANQSVAGINAVNMSVQGAARFGATGAIDSSAVIDAVSTTKGFLQPRMTTTQRNAIATPATGLSIYNTTTNTEDYYNGTAWVSLQTSITNPVTGTGTTNYLPKWTSSSVVGNSLVYDDGTNVGIGTTTPISGGSNAKWLTLEGSTYGGGIISSVSGVTKGAVYYDSATQSLAVQGSTSVGTTIWTNNLVRMSVATGGNVGIGTSTPNYKLDVIGVIRFSDSSTLSTNGGFVESTSTMVYFGAVASEDINLYTGGTSALYIKGSTRNVLIGTTTDAGYKLDVNGTQRVQYGTVERGAIFTHSNGTTAEIVIGNGSAAGVGVVEIQRNGTSAISMRSNAVLFNTSRLATPSTFFVTGPYGGSNIGTSVRLASNTVDQGVYTATSGTQSTVVIGNSGNEIWQPSSGNATYNLFSILPSINTSGTYAGIVRGFYYNPTLTSITGVTHRAIETVTGDVIFNSTSGSVGIGTTSPGQKLDVNGNIRLSSNSPSIISYTSYASNIFTVKAQQTSGQDIGGMIIDTGNGESRFGSFRLGGGYFTTFYVNNAELIRLSTSNNVLIGTTTDAGYKLDVNGSGRFTPNGTITAAFYIQTHGTYVNRTRLVVGATDGANNNSGLQFTASTGTGKTYINGWDDGGTSQYDIVISSNGGRVQFGTDSSSEASSQVTINSTTRGFLLPRMTDAQILAIASPANGLMVYSTTQNVIAFYDGTGWHKVTHTNL